MAWGVTQKLGVCTIASGAAESSALLIGGRSYNKFFIQVGTMSTAANIAIQNSMDDGSTYYNVYHPPVNSSAVQANQLYISSGVGTGGGAICVRDVPFNKIKFVATAVVSGGVSLTVYGCD